MSFIRIYVQFAQVLPAQMASHFLPEKFCVESGMSKNPRMHTGLLVDSSGLVP